MERLRSLTKVFAGAGLLALSTGCITITPPAKPAPAAPQQPAASGVVPAGGIPEAARPPENPTAQASSAPTISVSMPKIDLKLGKSGVKADRMLMAWSRRVEHLPDPMRDGAMGPGLVGQMYLLGGPGSNMPAEANGRLTVELFDESPGPNGAPPKSTFLGKWVFEKDALKGLVAVDDRWGQNYTLFLPWPGYSTAYTQVKLTGKFESETGQTLYTTKPSVVVIDTTLHGVEPGAPIPIAPYTVPQGVGNGQPLRPPAPLR